MPISNTVKDYIRLANPDEYGYVNQHGLSRKVGTTWTRGYVCVLTSPQHIFEAVKGSLERLQLDYIDVLQCHRFDYNTPVEETMQALHDVVKAGYVRYIGMSSCFAWQCMVLLGSLSLRPADRAGAQFGRCRVTRSSIG
jgi:aryl-alcohol dehydrogenase-like predicted oxidoreductase